MHERAQRWLEDIVRDVHYGLRALRRNPVLQLGGGQTIELANLRPPAAALTISAEAVFPPDNAPVAVVSCGGLCIASVAFAPSFT